MPDVTLPPFTPLGAQMGADVGYEGDNRGGRLLTPIPAAVRAACPELVEPNRQQAAFRVVVENGHAYVKSRFKIIGGLVTNAGVRRGDISELIITVSNPNTRDGG